MMNMNITDLSPFLLREIEEAHAIEKDLAEFPDDKKWDSEHVYLLNTLHRKHAVIGYWLCQLCK